MLVALGIVSVLAAAAAIVFVEPDDIRKILNPWDDPQQAIADAFPSLVGPAQNTQGWLGATCHEVTYGNKEAISCENKENGISFEVGDLGDSDRATQYVFFSVRDRAGDRDAAHPQSPTPLPVSIAPPSTGPGSFETGSVQDRMVFTRFVKDSQRSRFVFELEWANHKAEETFEQWWPKAPIGLNT